MRSGWAEKATMMLNRGFPRIYLLKMLKDKPMNAKEIIETSIINSGGAWKPSPRTIYQLLAKLLEDGLLYQTEEGQYALTRKGIRVVGDAGTVSRTLKKQVKYLGKLSALTGKAFVTRIKKRFS